MNANRRVVEIDNIAITVDDQTKILNAALSVAVWRPALYARFTAGPLRFEWAGIRGTRPGVDGYRTDVSCDDPSARNVRSTIYADGETLTDEGEVPRTSRRGALTLGTPCTIAIYPFNASYPEVTDDPIQGTVFVPRTIPRDDIDLLDPSTTLTWLEDLSVATDAIRSGQALVDDALHLFTFTAYAGYTYTFCAYPSSQSPETCATQTSEESGAALLIVGPSRVLTTVTDGKDGKLTWIAPASSSARTTYTLVVRRRARFEGSAPTYSYKLRYTIPAIKSCPLFDLDIVEACEPAATDDLSAETTHDTATATVTVAPSAGAHAVEFKRVSENEACTASGVTATVAVPSSSAASGAAGAASTPVSHPFGGLSASTTYKLCARSVRTIETGFVLRSGWVEASATTKALPKLTVTVRPTRASCYTNGSVSISWAVSGGTARYAVKVGGVAVSGNRKTVTCQARAGTQTVTVSATDSSTPQRSGSAAVTLTVTNPPVTPVTPPSLSLTVSVRPARCPGATVKVDWRTSGGRGTPTVTVNGDSVSTSPTSLVCQPTAGRQSISVTARDSTGTAGYSTSATVLAPPAPSSCLSGTAEGAATYGTGTSCGAVTASALLSVVQGANSDICAISHHRDGDWLRYGVASGGLVIPGSTDYTINPGNALWLSTCSSASGGAGGASSGEPPNCPDALKLEAGPAAVGLDGATCAIVRGGGAVQISRGDYTLSLSLPSERDWFVAAPTHYNENASGAFIFLDLTSGGWLALYPADAAELARHAPADGLPALLDALAAFASVPE